MDAAGFPNCPTLERGIAASLSWFWWQQSSQEKHGQPFKSTAQPLSYPPQNAVDTSALLICKWGAALCLQNQRQKSKTKLDQECNIRWKDHLGGQWARIGSREQRGSGSSSLWHQLLPFLRLTATVDTSYPSSSAALLCTWPSNWASVHNIWAQISGKLFPTPPKKTNKKKPPWKPPASSSC